MGSGKGVLMKITRVKSLKDLAVFDAYTPAPDEGHFYRFNLIYGFNGSGKTTLSRVFASVERASYCSDLPTGGRFELEVEGGVAITHDANLDRLKGHIAVFNEDFVENNFRWREGSANPVFYLGKEQAGLAAELEAAQKDLQDALQKRDERSRERSKADTNFSNFKRDTARNIADQFGLGRSYVATQLDRDYGRAKYPDRLTEDEQNDLRATMAQAAARPKIVLAETPKFDLTVFMDELVTSLKATAGAMTLADLREHQEMLRWVKEGLEYHREHDLDACLFCGNGLSEGRIAALDEVIDDKLDQITAEAERLLIVARTQRDELLSFASGLPTENDIAEGQARLAEITAETGKVVDWIRAVLLEAADLLEKKKANPNADLSAAIPTTHTNAPIGTRSFPDLALAINEIVENHNRAHDEFETRKLEALNRLKAHVLGLNEARYRQLESGLASAESAAEAATTKAATLNETAENLRRRLLQHGPAAEAINALVKAYLRHGSIEVVAAAGEDGGGEGFQIRRDGAGIVGVLSEGEKTAIALCYFISTLAAEGRRIRDLIVVVDDPISSLDSKALNYAFTILKSHLSGARQVFLLTHNIHFMNECRKWLRNMSKKDPPEAALMFIDVRQAADGKRSSRIEKLPKLLRDYESEYHYLFDHTHRFAQSEGLSYDYLYLMPNAMRKILDIFLAFKLPGPDGLGSKVEKIATLFPDFDGNRLKALERLVQLESHAENLDDLVSFSSMAIEEARDCAQAILALMVEMDKPHHDRLCELCR